MDLPKNWTKMTGRGVYDLVLLSTTDSEYKTVSQYFARTSTRPIVKVRQYLTY